MFKDHVVCLGFFRVKNIDYSDFFESYKGRYILPGIFYNLEFFYVVVKKVCSIHIMHMWMIMI